MRNLLAKERLFLAAAATIALAVLTWRFLLAPADAHHWPFGDMPPVDGIAAHEVDRIVAYVRTLQRANGIF